MTSGFDIRRRAKSSTSAFPSPCLAPRDCGKGGLRDTSAFAIVSTGRTNKEDTAARWAYRMIFLYILRRILSEKMARDHEVHGAEASRRLQRLGQ